MPRSILRLIDTETNRNVRVDVADAYVFLGGGKVYCVNIPGKDKVSYFKLFLDKQDEHKVLYQQFKLAGTKGLDVMAAIRIMAKDRKNLKPAPEVAWLKGNFRGTKYDMLVSLSDIEASIRWVETDPFVTMKATPLDNLAYVTKINDLRKRGKLPKCHLKRKAHRVKSRLKKVAPQTAKGVKKTKYKKR